MNKSDVVRAQVLATRGYRTEDSSCPSTKSESNDDDTIAGNATLPIDRTID